MILRPIASLAALGISTAAIAQPCHPGPRLFETDRDAYEAQARRVFAAHRIPYAEHRNYELDHRVPRCLAIGDYDGDDNLWPQPRAEALIKDDMEAEVCRLVCQSRTMPLAYAVELFLRIGGPAMASCSNTRQSKQPGDEEPSPGHSPYGLLGACSCFGARRIFIRHRRSACWS